jgi:hypothetical protein
MEQLITDTHIRKVNWPLLNPKFKYRIKKNIILPQPELGKFTANPHIILPYKIILILLFLLRLGSPIGRFLSG